MTNTTGRCNECGGLYGDHGCVTIGCPGDACATCKHDSLQCGPATCDCACHRWLTADPIDIMCKDAVTKTADEWDGDDLASFKRQAERHGVVVVRASALGWNDTFQVVVRGTEARLQAYLTEVGYGTDQGWSWAVVGDRLKGRN